MEPASHFVRAGGHELEYIEFPARQAARPTLVFLHEGLGSVAMWRGFPAQVALATGCRSIIYSRHGYGQSDLLAAPHATDYMHREARVALPDLLAALQVEHPVLFGHSDGGSIALIHAGSDHPVSGLILMAPHCFVEDISIASIAAAKRAAETTDLLARLARYHRDPHKTFYGWNDIWLHPDFRSWNIEHVLPSIRCPVLAMQGIDDEYGTLAQVEAIARGATQADVELLTLADCRHSPHKDQPDAVIAAVLRFLDALPCSNASTAGLPRTSTPA
jgi:pimeloyl-ACP methyl ester carboxylesterase